MFPEWKCNKSSVFIVFFKYCLCGQSRNKTPLGVNLTHIFIQSLEIFTGIKLPLSNFFRWDFYYPLCMMDCRSFWLPFSLLITGWPQVEQDPEACLQFLREVPAKTSTDQDNSSSWIFGKSIFAKLEALPITQFFPLKPFPYPQGLDQIISHCRRRRAYEGLPQMILSYWLTEVLQFDAVIVIP